MQGYREKEEESLSILGENEKLKRQIELLLREKEEKSKENKNIRQENDSLLFQLRSKHNTSRLNVRKLSLVPAPPARVASPPRSLPSVQLMREKVKSEQNLNAWKGFSDPLFVTLSFLIFPLAEKYRDRGANPSSSSSSNVTNFIGTKRGGELRKEEEKEEENGEGERVNGEGERVMIRCFICSKNVPVDAVDRHVCQRK